MFGGFLWGEGNYWEEHLHTNNVTVLHFAWPINCIDKVVWNKVVTKIYCFLIVDGIDRNRFIAKISLVNTIFYIKSRSIKINML